MKKLNNIATLFASVAIAGTAFAAGSTTNSDNWRNNHGNLQWKNGDGSLCWQNNYWTPATAAAECGGAAPVAVAEAEVVSPPPVVAPPKPVAPAAAEKLKFAADAFFDVDKSVLKPEGRAKLDDLASKVGGINLEVIVAVGHTDSDGSDAYNQRLSERRANAVKAYLVSKGVEAGRIFAEGKGETQPVAANTTREGKAQNRRVEVEVVGTPK